VPTIPEREGKLAATDDEVFQELCDRLRIAMEAEGENRVKGIECLEFLDGHQWDDDIYNQRKMARRPSLTINHTRTFRNRVVNNMRQQRPRIKVHPVGDGADTDTAEVVGGIIRHIENISHADVAYDTAGASAVDIGWGYIRLVADYIDEKSMDQEIKILPVRNTFTVYMDPAATMPAGEDAEWVIITEKMKRTEYKRQYPDADNVEFIKTGTGDNFAQWETKTEIRLAEYYRVCRKTERLYQLQDGSAAFADDLKRAGVATDHPIIVGSRMSCRRAIEWYKVNGRQIVDSRRMDKDPIPGEWIPVVRCEGNVLDLNGRVRRKGMIEDLIGPAQMTNYFKTAETEQLALASKAPWTGPEGFRNGHPEWNDANQTPYSSLEWAVVTIEQPDGSKTLVGKPERMAAIEVPAGFVQASQGAYQDLMSVAGMPHEPGQDTPGAVVSGVALQKRQALSDIGHYQYYDNQTQMIAQCGRIALGWIPVYYSGKRMQRILGEDGVPTMTEINTPEQGPDGVQTVKNDLSVGRYDVVMDTGPGYDTKRQESAESMIALMATPMGKEVAAKGADIVLRTFDWPGADQLADRMMPMTPENIKETMKDLPKKAQGIVTALAAHIQQQDAKIQEQASEIKYKTTIEHGWMQVEREKTQEKLKADSANNQTKQLDTHVKSITARDVAEINAGAKLIDSNQDRAHEKDLAKMTAAAAEKAESSVN
jgi:Phage P22-like portal protein